MKKILFLYHTSSIGGGSYCLLNILTEIDRENIQPVVLLQTNGPLSEEIKNLGIEVYFLEQLITVPYNTSALTIRNIINSFRRKKGLAAFKKILNEIKPDAVYVNTMMLYPFLKPAKQLGIKTLIHIREHWPEKEHKFQRAQAIGNIKQYSDQIIAINSYSASMVEGYNPPVSIVYDWIDLSGRYDNYHMSDIFNEDISDKKIYLFLGGLQQIKGTHEVIKAFSQGVSDKNARLLILGIENTSQLFSGLRGLVKKTLALLGKKTYSQQVIESINADPRIQCIAGRYKINNLIKEAYCILSFFKIPHANLALAESIILGTPTIAAETPESIEYSDNGELALLYRINDMVDFERHIIDFDNQRPALVQYIKSNSNVIAKMFDKKQNSDKLNQILALI